MPKSAGGGKRRGQAGGTNASASRPWRHRLRSCAKPRRSSPVQLSSPAATGSTIAENGESSVGNTRSSEPRIGLPVKKDGKTVSKHAETIDELNTLLGPSQEGDAQALSRLAEILEELPELARRVVDPAEQAELSMVRIYAGDDPFLQEVLPRTLGAMKAELAGENPSPLERLLAQRVAATWFLLQYLEALYAQHRDEMTMARDYHHQKLLDRAHRRTHYALRTLAKMRKLLKPSVAQINIAEKQINVAGGEVPGISAESPLREG